MKTETLRVAVILMNLGAPDCLSAVEPFLRNLFRDPEIISLPKFLREPLAWLMAKRRRQEAQHIYKYLGGRSPLLMNTHLQAKVLERYLGSAFRVFIAMRYWYPFTEAVVVDVLNYEPDHIILLPLYPQFSITTAGSSIKCWHLEAQKYGLNVPTSEIHHYPSMVGFIDATVHLIESALSTIDDLSNTHLLFSAHGLPERIIKQGDPYQQHVEESVAAVREKLKVKPFETSISYQSRVGPLKWIGPATDEEIKRLARLKKNIVIAPIAFVSEHSETLYELDFLYKNLAKEYGAPLFLRVPTVSTHSLFIQGLAQLCYDALEKNNG